LILLKILVLSQVVLSFALPFALIPLIFLTRRADLMSDLVNSRRTKRAGVFGGHYYRADGLAALPNLRRSF